LDSFKLVAVTPKYRSILKYIERRNERKRTFKELNIFKSIEILSKNPSIFMALQGIIEGIKNIIILTDAI